MPLCSPCTVQAMNLSFPHHLSDHRLPFSPLDGRGMAKKWHSSCKRPLGILVAPNSWVMGRRAEPARFPLLSLLSPFPARQRLPHSTRSSLKRFARKAVTLVNGFIDFVVSCLGALGDPVRRLSSGSRAGGRLYFPCTRFSVAPRRQVVKLLKWRKLRRISQETSETASFLVILQFCWLFKPFNISREKVCFDSGHLTENSVSTRKPLKVLLVKFPRFWKRGQTSDLDLKIHARLSPLFCRLSFAKSKWFFLSALVKKYEIRTLWNA